MLWELYYVTILYECEGSYIYFTGIIRFIPLTVLNNGCLDPDSHFGKPVRPLLSTVVYAKHAVHLLSQVVFKLYLNILKGVLNLDWFQTMNLSLGLNGNEQISIEGEFNIGVSPAVRYDCTSYRLWTCVYAQRHSYPHASLHLLLMYTCGHIFAIIFKYVKQLNTRLH